MPVTNRQTVPKNFRLDTAQLARARKALGASTDTETIVRALDFVISEQERNRLTVEANRRFIKSGISIRDVFGSLAD